MKAAYKVNKEGKKKKKDQLKSVHTQTTNRPIKNNKINSHKGEKVKNKYINN